MIRKLYLSDIEVVNKYLKNFNYELTKETLNREFLNVIVYEENGIKGVLVYSLIYDRIEIEYIGTLPNYQNKHIATELLTYLFEKETSVLNTTLEVDTNNKIAINLYQKFGFKIVTIKKNYYSKSDAYYMMRK